MPTFSTRLIQWQRQHGRNNLPWQTRDAYRVWLSEIMLQQTQVATVLDYYPRFLTAFPTVQALAAASQDQVLSLWAGLGYYSRARNLHAAAQQIVQQHGGAFPSTRAELETLKGVGRSTAAAIAAFAYHQREAILDGNVKRVLCRVFAQDGNPANKAFERQLWALAESLLPVRPGDMPAYTQGLMDLGATLCTRSKPRCHECPMQSLCQAHAQNRTAELPRKKSPAAVQQQTLYWLIIEQNHAVWLHKRPQRGIWAGLWCAPTFDSLADLQRFAAQHRIPFHHATELPAIQHRLTHRQLEIIPYRIAADLGSLKAEGCNEMQTTTGEWVTPQKFTQYGMPKPLAKLLAE